MIKQVKTAQYLAVSIAVHLVVIALLMQMKKPQLPANNKQDNKAIKSYLVIPAVKQQVVNEQLATTAIEQKPLAQQEPLAEQEPSAEQEPVEVANTPQPEPPTEPQPEQQTTENQQAENELAKTEQSSPKPSAQPARPIDKLAAPKVQSNPLLSARDFISSMSNQEVDKMAKQGLQKLLEVQPINPERGPKTKQQIMAELTKSFTAKGSGVKVVAEVSNNETLVLVHGNCMMITQNTRGEQVWSGSTACGKTDNTEQQLKASLKKYLDRGY